MEVFFLGPVRPPLFPWVSEGPGKPPLLPWLRDRPRKPPFLPSLMAGSAGIESSMAVSQNNLLIVGPGVLGRLVAQQWRQVDIFNISKSSSLPPSIKCSRIRTCSSPWKLQRYDFSKLQYKSTRSSFLSSFQPCKATSDKSGRAVSGESILLNEQTLERELEVAIEQENYAEAARIRDRIRVLHEDSEASVLAANARFYNAFRAGDLASMQNLWGKGDNVCCVHPGASGISSYDLVMRSWEYVWVDYEFPLEIELRDVQVYVKGDAGYVTCVELVRTKGSSWGRQFATNVFERVDGHWLICVHHASIVES